MGIPGRKPEPIPLRILKGNTQRRPIPNIIKTDTAIPFCPQWLNPVAKTEWKRASKLLLKMKILSAIDMVAFAGYCENYAVLVQCGNYIKKKGGYAKYFEDKNSQNQPHFTAMNKAWQNIKAFCAEFGMSPSSRGRIVIPEKERKGRGGLD